MVKITEAQIRRVMPNAPKERVTGFVDSFNKWAEKFSIDTPLRVAHYIAQVAHETAELKYVEENLNYSAEGLLKVFPKYFNKQTAEQYARQPEKIANKVYANRMGNGNEASGDGWKFKGRAYLQVTGKNNYQSYASSEYCNGDLMNHPEWLAQQPGCQKASMFYWKKNMLNRFADRDDTYALTKAINGGTNGLAQRSYYTRVAKRVFMI